MKKLQINQKRFKYGTLATVISVIFIAVVVLVNVVVSMVLDRFPAKIDLTENKLFSLSDQSIDFLKTIDKEIEVTVLSDEASLSTAGTTAKQVVEIINKYAQYASGIKINFVNPDKNPEVITRFNDLYKGDVSSKFVIVTSGDRIKALSVTDLISSETSYNSDYTSTSTITKSTAEQAMTSALMYITDANPMKVTVLTTESVADISSFVTLLETNGYEIETVDLLTGTIDPESALVVLNSPANDLSDDQITKLADYVDNSGKLGKNLLYMAAFGQKDTPKLDAFLAEWGLEVAHGYTMDSNTNNLASVGSGVYGIYTKVSNETYGKDLQNSDLPALSVLSRPINLLFASDSNGRSTEALLTTENTAYIVPEDATSETDINSLEKQAVNIMAVGAKDVYVGNDKSTSRVMAFGSGLFVNASFMESNSLNNGDYALSAVHAMTGKSAGISIVAKDLTQAKLSMTQAQANVLKNVVILFIPLAIIAIGIVIWVRRRNR